MVPIPLGTVAFNAKEAFYVSRKFGSDYQGKYVVKAQVKLPGRSDAHFIESDFRGGIHIVDTIHEVKETAEKMLGKHCVVPKRPSEAVLCNAVMVMEYMAPEASFFLQLSYDIKRMVPVISYSRKGGISHEELLKNHPESLKHVYIDYMKGINMFDVMKVASDLGVAEKTSAFNFLIKNMYECFVQNDCMMIQLSPLVLTSDNKFRAANVKIVIDDSALYRQQKL